MFVGTPKDVVDEIAEDYNLGDLDKKIIQKYLELNAGQRKVLKDYLKSIFEQKRAGYLPAPQIKNL